ncbi:hypothetical protein KCU62_g301, partial [Aureobasidium sp. EXF-3399]
MVGKGRGRGCRRARENPKRDDVAGHATWGSPVLLGDSSCPLVSPNLPAPITGNFGSPCHRHLAPPRGHVRLSIFCTVIVAVTATFSLLKLLHTTWTGLVVFSNHNMMIVVWQHNRAAVLRGSVAAQCPFVHMFHLPTRTVSQGMMLAAATTRRDRHLNLGLQAFSSIKQALCLDSTLFTPLPVQTINLLHRGEGQDIATILIRHSGASSKTTGGRRSRGTLNVRTHILES